MYTSTGDTGYPHDYRDLDAERDWAQARASDPILGRFLYVVFVSRSAGKGRKRRPREVELFGDSYEQHPHYYTPSRFPADEKASEVPTLGAYVRPVEELFRRLRSAHI